MINADTSDLKLRETFGANVRQLRKIRELTQVEVASQLDLSLEMVGRMERGAAGASFKTLARLSDLYGVPVYRLFGGEHQEELKNARTRTLDQIEVSLSKLSDEELEKAKKLLDVLVAS